MRRTLIALASLAHFGCSSADSAESSPAQQVRTQTNACVTKGASYVVSFTETGGDCGRVPDQVVNTGTDGTVMTTTNCTGELRNDGCDVTLTNYECPGEKAGTIKQTGKVTWAADGSGATGTVQYVLTLGADTCTSTYRVTYRRQ